jgi:class 3 adenylate cyclase
MLTFAAPRDAVRCALEIERLASAEPRFPAVRAGIHCGTVRLTLAGAELAFCSTSCLQRYVGDPTRYRPSSSPRTGGDP